MTFATRQSQPSAEETSRVLRLLSFLADQLETTYWLAWIHGGFFAIDNAFPDEPLIFRETEMVRLAIQLDVRGMARWYIAQDDIVLDLA